LFQLSRDVLSLDDMNDNRKHTNGFLVVICRWIASFQHELKSFRGADYRPYSLFHQGIALLELSKRSGYSTEIRLSQETIKGGKQTVKDSINADIVIVKGRIDALRRTLQRGSNPSSTQHI
jgi:hypothetical protein